MADDAKSCMFSDLLRAMRDPSITPYQAKLLCIYRSYETEDEGAYPGDPLVAEHMGTSASQMRKHRKPLLDSGLLAQKLGGGGRKARYRVVVDPVSAVHVARQREEKKGIPYIEKGNSMSLSNSTRRGSDPSREGAQAREDARAREAGFTDADEMRTLTELRARDDGRYVPGGTFDIEVGASVTPIGHAPSLATNKPTDETCTCTGSFHQKGVDPHCAYARQETGT